MVLKPHYAKKHVAKEEYKEILRKAVPKVTLIRYNLLSWEFKDALR